MPDLLRSLQGRDLGHLRIVAELWGETLEAADLRSGLRRLPDLLLRPEAVHEMLETLPDEARSALEELAAAGGRLPWPLFSRRFGSLREMGPGKRDRELPHRSPDSPAEVLWYRALVARAFFDTPNGPQEHAYIPDDLLPLLPSRRSAPVENLGRAASPLERAQPLPAGDRLLDHACTLLAALRLGLPAAEIQALEKEWLFPGATPLTSAALLALLEAAGLLDTQGLPQPEPTRLFLEAPRAEALRLLLRAWLSSPTLNDLRLTPGLRTDGEWSNDPLRTRQALLDFLSAVPGCRATVTGDAAAEAMERPYWSLAAFVQDVRRQAPDFQRPAGDYDSWYIRSQSSGEFLRGFEHWDEVDGALLRYLICGPLHWLGALDLAEPPSPAAPLDELERGARASAFRASAWAGDLLAGRAPAGLPAEEAAILVRSDFRLHVPRLAPRSLRYQLARFAAWEEPKDETYHYRLTPSSLLRAQRQGLTVNHLLALLRRATHTLPPNLVRTLERWERQGTEARIQPLVVLRFSSPDLLLALRTSKSARFLGEPLGPTAVIVKPGAVEKVLAALAEMGILAEATID